MGDFVNHNLKLQATAHRALKPSLLSRKVGFSMRVVTFILVNGLIASSAGAQEAVLECETVLSETFFRTVTIEKVGRCLDTQNINNRDPNGNTPLHFAILTEADPAVIRTMLRIGANPNLRNIDERTPLHLAAMHASSGDAIAALLNYNADIDARIQRNWDWTTGVTGTTALHLAARRDGGTNAVGALLLGGADINARAAGTGRTPLHFAATLIDAGTMDLLRRAGAEADYKDNDGNSALHIAASETRSSYIVYLLLLAGGSVDAPNNDETTPLMLAAAYNKSAEVVQAFFDASKAPCEEDDEGRTALSNATQNPDIYQTEVYWSLFQLCTAGD